MKRTGKDFKSWVHKHREELRVGGVAAAVVFFFTHGLPLWNDDYGKWLAQADASFISLVTRLILPITTDLQNWGFKDRPGEVLIYKFLYTIFGDWGTGFYFVKSLVFGALSALLYRNLRKAGHERFACNLGIALFVLSTSTIATLVWHSDFGVYSQLILAVILFWALPYVERGPSHASIYKHFPKGLSRGFSHFLIAFFCAVYFGAKVRGDVRLAPVILLGYLYVYRREKFAVFAPPFAVTFLASLPWSLDMFKHRPLFFPGAAAFVKQVVQFMVGGAFTLNAPAVSVISAAGVIVVAGLAVYAGYLVYSEKMDAPNNKWGFYLIWFASALLLCGIVPAGSSVSPIRYTFMLLVPATCLVTMTLTAIFHEFPRAQWIRHAAVLAVVLQCGVHFYHDCQIRREVGHQRVAVSKTFALMEKQFPNAQFLTAQGFSGIKYKSQTSSSVTNRSELANIDDIAKFPVGNTYVAIGAPTLDVRFAVADAISGCGDSLFDKIFPCSASETVTLWKYVGTPAETAQATEFERTGDIASARRVLEGYLQKEPTNYGVAFMLSLYTYRQGDFARMEQIYDQIGPHFEGYAAVVYNWGLAKQGLQKFAEATRYLEIANRMAPDNYGIIYNLADSYYKEGRKTRALATLSSVMKRYPNDEAMKRSYEEWSKK